MYAKKMKALSVGKNMKAFVGVWNRAFYEGSEQRCQMRCL